MLDGKDAYRYARQRLGFVTYWRCRASDVLRNLLRRFGYYKIDYGFTCGRHWIEIDGKVIAQTAGDDVWMRDEDVHRLGYAVLDHGKHWTAPND